MMNISCKYCSNQDIVHIMGEIPVMVSVQVTNITPQESLESKDYVKIIPLSVSLGVGSEVLLNPRLHCGSCGKLLHLPNTGSIDEVTSLMDQVQDILKQRLGQG